jgi:hypothetical protein
MLALLSSPIRRWLLAALLLPLVVWLLAKAGRFVERRNDGQTTKLSRLLLRSSSALERFTRGGRRADRDELSARRAPENSVTP